MSNDSHIYRKIYEDAYGPIPTNYVIHHIDGNHYNNELTNLYCCSKSEHIQIHSMQGDINDSEQGLIAANVRWSSKEQLSLQSEKMLGNSYRKGIPTSELQKNCVSLVGKRTMSKKYSHPHAPDKLMNKQSWSRFYKHKLDLSLLTPHFQ